MILLVPISPEVPKYHIPRLWPGLILVILLGAGFLLTDDTLLADSNYVDGAMRILAPDDDWTHVSDSEIAMMFSRRPLLSITPCRADWDVKRLLIANFVHGGKVHLLLNLIGAFAGARICATFMPFFLTFFVFLFGGSLGILGSILLSSESFGYVPHVGASGGIFALMGAYYIYNFRFRTRYFFWFPTRKGKLALPTSWFFFLDVILLELVFSAAQLTPTRVDNVDHLAHVIGFIAGMVVAMVLRAGLRWPTFLQTRVEVVHWKNRSPVEADATHRPFETWLQCLSINPYNDQIKLKLCKILIRNSGKFSYEELSRAFKYLSPTFVKSHTAITAEVVKHVLARKQTIPRIWLRDLPYDVVIRIAKEMTQPPEEQFLLFRFVDSYKNALPAESGFNHKLELLIGRLGGFVRPKSADDQDENRNNEAANNNRNQAK